MGNYSKALKHLEKQIELEPQLIYPHIFQGLIHKCLGNKIQMDMELAKVLKLSTQEMYKTKRKPVKCLKF